MPIKFEIYRDGNRVTVFEPVAATAMGPESVPIPGEISFRDGLLVVNRKDDMPCGLSLLWDCGPLGAVQLETTRLLPRDKPYNLNVELARSRLMKIMQKQEDWSLFDFPKAERFATRFAEAEDMFCRCAGQARSRRVKPRSSPIRRWRWRIDISEELTNFHGDLLLSRRRAAGQLRSPHLRLPGRSDRAE